jgi:hypothetical protein
LSGENIPLERETPDPLKRNSEPRAREVRFWDSCLITHDTAFSGKWDGRASKLRPAGATFIVYRSPIWQDFADRGRPG